MTATVSTRDEVDGVAANNNRVVNVTVLDQVRPTIAVGTPSCRKSSRTTRTCTFKGSSADAGGISKVQINVTKKVTGGCLVFTGTRWTKKGCAAAKNVWVTVAIKAGPWAKVAKGATPGSLVIRARAYDKSNNLSAIASKTYRLR
jgi:hypothetical protein